MTLTEAIAVLLSQTHGHLHGQRVDVSPRLMAEARFIVDQVAANAATNDSILLKRSGKWIRSSEHFGDDKWIFHWSEGTHYAGQENDPLAEPLPGTLWRHYKGGLYKVHGMANFEANLERQVVYEKWDADVLRTSGSGGTWTRPLADWNAPIYKDGLVIPIRRFEPYFGRDDGVSNGKLSAPAALPA